MNYDNSPDLTPDAMKSVIQVKGFNELESNLRAHIEKHGHPDKIRHEHKAFNNRHYWCIRMLYANKEKTLLFTADWLDF